jgi:hypothetical protein
MSLRTLVGEYHTRTGKVGVKIYRSEGSEVSRDHYGFPATYSYNGLWGAGSGHGLAQIQKDVKYWLEHKRGIKTIVPFAELAMPAMPPGTSRG